MLDYALLIASEVTVNKIAEEVNKAHDQYRLGIIATLSDDDLIALAQGRGVRPCEIEGKPARFIRWLHREWSYMPMLLNGVPTKESGMFAFVEMADGTMNTVPSKDVRFTDV